MKWEQPLSGIEEAVKLLSGDKLRTLQFRHRQDQYSDGIDHMMYSRSVPDKLGSPQIEDAGVKKLLGALKKAKKLEGLDLSGNNLTSEGMVKLGEFLEKNETIKALYLEDNKLNDEDMEVFKDVLKKNRHLEELCLSGNNITSKGAVILSEGLKKNQGLTKLWLNRNEIRDEGAKALGKAVKKHEDIKLLALEDNRVRERGAKVLAKAYAKNKGMKELNVGGNKIGSKGAKYFNKTLKKDSQEGRKLIIDGNRLHEDDLELLRAKGGAKGVSVEGRVFYEARDKEPVATRAWNYLKYHTKKYKGHFDDEQDVKKAL